MNLRVENLLICFSSKSLVCCEQKNKKMIFSWSLFCKEQLELFAHGRSFEKSDEKESLQSRATEQRVTGVIRSWA